MTKLATKMNGYKLKTAISFFSSTSTSGLADRQQREGNAEEPSSRAFSRTVIAMAILNCVSVFRPVPTTDEGIYFFIGRSMREGLLPYRNLWDTKPIAMYWITSVISYLPSPFVAGRVLMIAVFSLLAYLLSGKLEATRRRTRVILVVFWVAILFNPLFEANFFLTEPIESIFILCGWYLAMRTVAERSTSRAIVGAILCGTSFGLGMNARPTALAFVLPVVIFILRGLQRQRLRLVLSFSVVLGLATTNCIVALTLRHLGVLHSCIEEVWIANFWLRTRMPFAEVVRNWQLQVGMLTTISFAIVLMCLGIVKDWPRRSRHFELFFWSALIALGEGFATRKPSHHHFATFAFTVAPLAFYGIRYLETLESKTRRALYNCLTLLAIVPLVFWSGPEAALPILEFARPNPKNQEFRSLSKEINHGEYMWSGIAGGEVYWYTYAQPSSSYFQITGDFLRAVPDPWKKIVSDFADKPPRLIVVPENWTTTSGTVSENCPDEIRQYIESGFLLTMRLKAADAAVFTRR